MRNERTPWWAWDESDRRASELQALVSSLEVYQNGRNYDLLRYGSMYANRDLLSMSRSSTDPYLPQMPRQIINTTQSILDTFVAEAVESESKPTFDVDDGDWEAHQKAEDLDKFVWGEMYRLKCMELLRLGFRDAGWAGDGWVKFVQRDKKVYAERTLPLEILIDEAAAMSGPPQEMYQRRYVSRSYAMSLFPDRADEIGLLSNETAPYMWPGTDSDMVVLYEGWHLAQGKTKGRHILCCGTVVLSDDEWPYEVFPFARMTWNPAILGGYSQGLVEILAPLQLELNKMMKRIQHSLHLMSVPRVWQNSATKVNPEYDNLIGNVYKYSGPKPEFDIAPAVNPELYAQADRIRERMYEQARTNPVRAQGQMPSRIDSRPGFEEWVTTADSANAWLWKMQQDFTLQCAEQIIRVAKEIVKEHGSYQAFGRAKDFIEKLDFKDFDLEDDRFVIKLQATNFLPSTITGKRLAFMKLAELPMFANSPDDLLEMAGDHPDLKGLMKRKNVNRELVEKQMYSIIRKRKYFGPEQYQDLPAAKQFAQETWLAQYMKTANPEVLNDLERFIRDCDTIIQMIEPPPPPPAAAPGVPPGSPSPVPSSPGIPPQPPIG